MRRTNQLISQILFSLLLLTGCATRVPEISPPLVVVRYTLHPFGTFTIEGVEGRVIKLDRLAEELTIHHQNHPGTTYEFVSDIKCMMEEREMIMQAFRSAGVKPVHFWLPTSAFSMDSDENPGRHGFKIDMLNLEEAQ